MRVLNEEQHRDRVRQLKRQGCKVRLVGVPQGTLVVKRCPKKRGGLGEVRRDHASPSGQLSKWFAGAAALAGAIFVFNAVKTADAKAA